MSGLAATVAALRAASGVTALTGDSGIVPMEAPQGERPPLVVVDVVSEVDGRKFDGADEYPDTRVQLSCLDRSPHGADRLAEACIAALQNLSGTFAGRECVFRRAETRYHDAAPDRSIYRVAIDFYCMHRAS